MGLISFCPYFTLLHKFRNVHGFRNDTFEHVFHFPIFIIKKGNISAIKRGYILFTEKKKSHCMRREIVSYPCIEIVCDIFYVF